MKKFGYWILLPLLAFPAAAQTPADFYDGSTIQDIELEIHPKDWSALRANFLDNTYYAANFRWRGIVLENIGVRSRGRGSRSGVKPNLRLDFDRYVDAQKFLGLKSSMLKANNQDASLMRERIAMPLFESMGIPAPRETYARLHVNGEYFGLYNLIESIDKDFLRRTLGENDGYLYEWKPQGDGAGYHFEYLGESAESYSPVYFDPVTHEKDPNPQPLVEMIRAINESSDDEFVDTISRYLDPKQFLTYLAAETYLAEFDGFLGGPFGMNNFYVYRNAAGIHVFIPWDKDGTFSHEQREIFDGAEQNVLTRRLLAREEYRQFFFDMLMQAAATMGASGGAMEEAINSLYNQVAVDARIDPNKQCSTGGVIGSCGAEEFEAGVDEARRFAQSRAMNVVMQAYSYGYVPETMRAAPLPSSGMK